MGRRSVTSGVRAKGTNRIEFDFEYEGRRLRPTVKRIPSEGNLKRAAKQLEEIRKRIENGSFVFAEEFPDARRVEVVSGDQRAISCDEVFDEFLGHCESRVAKNDMAFATLEDYRKILKQVVRPKIGKVPFGEVRYSQLVKIVDAYQWSKLE